MTERRKKIISLVNNKGGVGKTTSAVNLAAGLAGKGRRVLLVDLDAQGSASLSVGFTRGELRPGSAEVILEGLPLEKAIRSKGALDVVPGSTGLFSADLALADARGRERILSGILDPVRGDYDFIILDCPPSLGLLTVNALTAADAYIVTMTPDYLAVEGLVNLLEAVEKIKAGIGHVGELLGILLTLCDYRLNATREIIELIRGHYKEKVFRVEIPGNVRLKEAPSFGKDIFSYAPGSTGAEAYRLLTSEVLGRIK